MSHACCLVHVVLSVEVSTCMCYFPGDGCCFQTFGGYLLKAFWLNWSPIKSEVVSGFLSYVMIEMLCTKFWLACQGVFSMRCTTTNLYEVLYNDFLKSDAPYKVSVWIKRIKCLLKESVKVAIRSVFNVEELFKIAQQEINLQPLGPNHHNLDLYCIFDLAVGASISCFLDQPSKETKNQTFSNN